MNTAPWRAQTKLRCSVNRWTFTSSILLKSLFKIRERAVADSRFAVSSFILMCTKGKMMSKNVEDDAEELGEQSAYEDTTEFTRRLRRGDESKGDPDERDVAGDYAEDSSTADTASDQGLVRRDVPS